MRRHPLCISRSNSVFIELDKKRVRALYDIKNHALTCIEKSAILNHFQNLLTNHEIVCDLFGEANRNIVALKEKVAELEHKCEKKEDGDGDVTPPPPAVLAAYPPPSKRRRHTPRGTPVCVLCKGAVATCVAVSCGHLCLCAKCLPGNEHKCVVCDLETTFYSRVTW
jgi:hypothetical protein